MPTSTTPPPPQQHVEFPTWAVQTWQWSSSLVLSIAVLGLLSFCFYACFTWRGWWSLSGHPITKVGGISALVLYLWINVNVSHSDRPDFDLSDVARWVGKVAQAAESTDTDTTPRWATIIIVLLSIIVGLLIKTTSRKR